MRVSVRSMATTQQCTQLFTGFVGYTGTLFFGLPFNKNEICNQMQSVPVGLKS